MSRVLYVEDNELIATQIKEYLEHENIYVDICPLIKKVEEKIENNTYDLILLDIILPDGNGINLYNKIKSIIDVPIIFLTAKDSEEDVVNGIDLGAEDYIVKPFRMRELTSRIRNVLKRKQKQFVINIDNIRFYENNNLIYKNGEKVNLTALEYRIFSILIENVNKIVTREYLLGRIWDMSCNFVNDNTLTVYMKRLREKIEDDPNNPTIIKTIRGIGYKIEKD